MAPTTARAALEPLWLAVIELAEACNDRIVAGHRRRALRQAREIANLSSELAGLTHAAAILARHADTRR